MTEEIKKEEREFKIPEEIVEEDLKSGKYKQIATVSAWAKWLFAYRSCLQHLFEFWVDKNIPVIPIFVLMIQIP